MQGLPHSRFSGEEFPAFPEPPPPLALTVGNEGVRVNFRETGCWDAWAPPQGTWKPRKGAPPPTSCGTGHTLPWVPWAAYFLLGPGLHPRIRWTGVRTDRPGWTASGPPQPSPGAALVRRQIQALGGREQGRRRGESQPGGQAAPLCRGLEEAAADGAEAAPTFLSPAPSSSWGSTPFM